MIEKYTSAREFIDFLNILPEEKKDEEIGIVERKYYPETNQEYLKITFGFWIEKKECLCHEKN